MALKRVSDTQPLLQMCCINEWGGMGAYDEAFGMSLGETAPSQILAVVAHIQMKTFKTEVEKGSM